MLSWVLLSLLQASFLSGQLARFSLLSPQVHFIPLDLFIGLLVSVSFISSPRRFVADFAGSPLSLPLSIFTGISLVSLSLATARYGFSAALIGSLYLLRWLIYSISFIAFKPLLRRFSNTFLLFATGLFIAGSGLFQYLVFPDTRSLQLLDWDPHYFRVIGSFLDPGYTGLLLSFILVLILMIHWRKMVVGLLLWLFFYIVFVLTYSRSSYLAYLMMLAAYSQLTKQRVKAIIFALILLITLPILPRAPQGEGVKLERTSSIAARIKNWQQSISIFARYPLTGVGFNTYRFAQHQAGYLDPESWQLSHAGAGADSSLLFVAATTGILGLAAYIFYLRCLFTLPSMPLKVFLVGVLFHSLFLNSLFYPFVLVWLAILTASAHQRV